MFACLAVDVCPTYVCNASSPPILTSCYLVCVCVCVCLQVIVSNLAKEQLRDFHNDLQIEEA